jgi:hypothetical protein
MLALHDGQPHAGTVSESWTYLFHRKYSITVVFNRRNWISHIGIMDTQVLEATVVASGRICRAFNNVT